MICDRTMGMKGLVCANSNMIYMNTIDISLY
jgi:hypothetical protein